VHDTTTLIIGLVAVFAGLVLVLVAFGAGLARRTGVSRSLAAVAAMGAAPASMQSERDVPFDERVLGPLVQRLTDLGRRFTPAGQVTKIRQRLDLAGNPEGWDVDRVFALKMICLLLGAAVGAALALAFSWGPWVLIGLVVVLGGIGLMAPNAYLYQKAYERSERIRKDLPDALDLLTISVEAGLSFDAALAEVARNTPGPLAGEFFRVLQEMQFGSGRSDAIRAMGERSDVVELKQFTTAMVQADAFGIPIANVLRIQSREMRIKRSQRAEEMAQKIPVKILFPLVFCILPSLFIVILGPGVITIVHNLFGVHA